MIHWIISKFTANMAIRNISFFLSATRLVSTYTPIENIKCFLSRHSHSFPLKYLKMEPDLMQQVMKHYEWKRKNVQHGENDVIETESQHTRSA